MRHPFGYLLVTILGGVTLGAAPQTSIRGATAAPALTCVPSKNGKAVVCPVGAAYPAASVCEPRGKRMVCRSVPPGTILTPR